MQRAGLPYLLILLLATAWVDDAVAAATPDPDDDRCALQDNEYLPASVRTGARCSPGDSFFPAPPPAGPAAPAPAAAPARPGPGPEPARPPLLYDLMSLQR